MLTARLTPRPVRLVAALALVPVLLVGGAGGAAALPELPGSSPEPSSPPSSPPSEPEPEPAPPPPETSEPAPARTTESAQEPAPARSTPASLSVAPSPAASVEPAAPAPAVTSPLPVGEVSGSPSPEPTEIELDDEPVADSAAPGDPLMRLVLTAVAAGLLLGVTGGVGLYLTRKSRGAHG